MKNVLARGGVEFLAVFIGIILYSPVIKATFDESTFEIILSYSFFYATSPYQRTLSIIIKPLISSKLNDLS